MLPTPQADTKDALQAMATLHPSFSETVDSSSGDGMVFYLMNLPGLHH